MSVGSGNAAAVNVNWLSNATDARDGTRPTSCVPAAGSSFGFGATSVTCQAQDTVGNINTCSFTVTVSDDFAPQLNCPESVEQTAASGSTQAEITFDEAVTVIDNAPGAAVVCATPSSNMYPIGLTRVTCTATDSAGLVSECTVPVLIMSPDGPVLGCPADVRLELRAGESSMQLGEEPAPIAITTIVNSTLACNATADTIFNVGHNTVICTAMDAQDRQGSCSYTVTVADVTLPTFQTCPSDRTVGTDAGNSEATMTWSAPTATDDIGDAVVACNPAGNILPIGSNTVTCIATDGAGNQAECTYTVTVVDDEAPLLSCNNVTRNIPYPDVEASVDLSFVSVIDNVDSTLSASCNASKHGVGTHAVGCVATDRAGNTAQCVFYATFFYNCEVVMLPWENFACSACPDPMQARSSHVLRSASVGGLACNIVREERACPDACRTLRSKMEIVGVNAAAYDDAAEMVLKEGVVTYLQKQDVFVETKSVTIISATAAPQSRRRDYSNKLNVEYTVEVAGRRNLEKLQTASLALSAEAGTQALLQSIQTAGNASAWLSSDATIAHTAVRELTINRQPASPSTEETSSSNMPVIIGACGGAAALLAVLALLLLRKRSNGTQPAKASPVIGHRPSRHVGLAHRDLPESNSQRMSRRESRMDVAMFDNPAYDPSTLTQDQDGDTEEADKDGGYVKINAEEGAGADDGAAAEAAFEAQEKAREKAEKKAKKAKKAVKAASKPVETSDTTESAAKTKPAGKVHVTEPPAFHNTVHRHATAPARVPGHAPESEPEAAPSQATLQRRMLDMRAMQQRQLEQQAALQRHAMRQHQESMKKQREAKRQQRQQAQGDEGHQQQGGGIQRGAESRISMPSFGAGGFMDVNSLLTTVDLDGQLADLEDDDMLQIGSCGSKGSKGGLSCHRLPLQPLAQ
eukprot:TRINITY_DN12343_c1_g1_i2.p1 TRINITY_DN12343_c1_g1~~TRINITY_DN12343_c1_g1_i2.p1  ORF type:complete len:1022 (+),score=263.65 TRINITY_DN12343_c1_g1_i2:304-3066(+)